ncbi:MAG: malonate decarboxylase subunit epsilon [Pseudomonadota bacterium]|nr:malonate decarboxylase subunit epsilon [Pseudomonadota bacterium]
MTIAFLFPGQGAQTTGFLHRLPAHPAVQATLAEAGAVLGRDVLELDTEDALRSTVAVQLASLVAGVAVARALVADGVAPDAVAGLSSGAYTAAVACGALTLAQALPLLQLRGQLMERAYPRGYGLLALVGLTEGRVRTLVAALHTPAQPLYLANLNAPTQIVLAGSDQALAAAQVAARAAGARTAHRMAVSVPSHCVLMDSVATALTAALAAIPIQDARIPYIGNVRGRALRAGADIGADLANNVAHAVRWQDATTVLYEMGMRAYFEMPPGTVLTGLAQDSLPDVVARSLDNTPLATIVYLAQRA